MSKIDYSLYLVTDTKLCLGRDLLEIVEQAVLGGVNIVQLREKELPENDFLTLAYKMKKLLDAKNIPLIINDNVHIAKKIGASGVHVGQSDMPVPEVRKILGPKAIIGLSIENKEQALESLKYKDILDYVGVSPVFDTPTKTDTAPAWGLKGVAWAKINLPYPIVAIGGVNKNTAKDIIQSGADSIAVVSAICSAENPRLAAEELRLMF